MWATYFEVNEAGHTTKEISLLLCVYVFDEISIDCTV